MRLSAACALFALLSLASCHEEDDSRPVSYEVRMATLHRSGRDFILDVDNVGQRAVPDSTLLVKRGLREDGQRLIASYTSAYSGSGAASAVLYDVRGVLTKSFSDAPADESASKALGEDAVDVAAVWLAGGYLNVGMRLSPVTASKAHTVAAYLTGDKRDALPVVELRHNLNGNASATDGSLSYASFALPAGGGVGEGCYLTYLSARGTKRYVRVSGSTGGVAVADSEDSQDTGLGQ